jgi:hypothetical protein
MGRWSRAEIESAFARHEQVVVEIGQINVYWESAAGLHAGHGDMICIPLNCHVVGLVARDFHPAFNPERELMRVSAHLFHRQNPRRPPGF